MDGLATRCVNRDGVLCAVDPRQRRGGEDVTHNLRTIRRIPLRLEERAPARGARQARHVAARLRRAQRAPHRAGAATFMNPRTGPGTIRQLDPAIAAAARVDVVLRRRRHRGAPPLESLGELSRWVAGARVPRQRRRQAAGGRRTRSSRSASHWQERRGGARLRDRRLSPRRLMTSSCSAGSASWAATRAGPWPEAPAHHRGDAAAP